MKLITFQTMDAFRELVDRGCLECREPFVNLEKSGHAYRWVREKMAESVPNPHHANYPLWAWVKFKRGICPPRHKGEPVKAFEVKITFHKPEEEVWVTDFRRYSFLLNNLYIPDTLADKEKFDAELAKYQISKDDLKAYVRPDLFPEHRQDREFLEICRRIRAGFDRCITADSDVLQGCVWRIVLEDVEKIELLHDRNYCCGSFNYVRSDGKRFDWQEEYYRMLK